VIHLAVDKEKNTQVLVTFPNEILEAIETYWHENKLKNRNEAIRELVQKGLKDSK
jgi:metal-responsive CopG/Arc/MetJ family transcriptional regulator